MVRLIFALFLLNPLLISLTANPHYDYSFALLRGLSSGFTDSLKQEEPDQPIDVDLAINQHEDYSQVVRDLVPHSVTLPADVRYPDCNFIEDTAILVGREAVISRMGARERQGEEVAVRNALNDMPFVTIHELTYPASMDGGDILYTGKHLFVGISSRTNLDATQQLSEIFNKRLEVVPIYVSGTLHLKSLISLYDEKTIVIADDEDGRRIMHAIKYATPDYQFLMVPDRVASNILRIKDTIVIQKGFPRSEQILREKAKGDGVEVITLEMSELIKADGALTCGSLLF